MDNLKKYLEELMELGQQAEIKYRSVDGALTVLEGHIVQMEEVLGREIIETDEGMVLAADQIMEVNGRSFENIC